LVGFLDSTGATSLENVVRYGFAADLIEALGLKPIPKLKAEEFFGGLRAARVETAGQQGFSYKDRQHSSYKPDEDDVGRFTADEMSSYFETLFKETMPVYHLAYHFTSEENLAKILHRSSLGLRASRGGQLAGGLYVCKRPPHALDWQPFCGDGFRTTVGKTLWGTKWQQVLSSGPDAKKLEVLLVLEVPTDIVFDGSNDVPNRSDITCISRSCLFEAFGQHYFSKERIKRVLRLTK